VWDLRGVAGRKRASLTAAGAERVYEETGSGKKGASRPVWDQMLQCLRSGDTLMVTELSRLGRSTSELAALADNLNEQGVALRILNLGIDTGTISGKLRA
jgi:DNA invertase Pin-like site-specific DNA recombinase